jgi:hypothetical protein
MARSGSSRVSGSSADNPLIVKARWREHRSLRRLSLLKSTSWDPLRILEFGVHSLFVRDLSNVWGFGGISGASSRDSNHKNKKEERLSATKLCPSGTTLSSHNCELVLA